jgi:signal transduction histidine kinase
VDWHDGTVEVDSVEGEGTTVTVRIPQASSAQS